MTYSLSPKKSAYATNADSSSDIIVKLKIKIYDSERSIIPIQTKDYTIILKKKQSFMSSGEITVLLSSNNPSEVYWTYSIESGDGTIGVEQ